MTSSTKRVVEVLFEDHEPRKWSVPLKEDAFVTLMEKEKNPGVFGDGSLFSPLLFGKFFDPSDAFPLWEFDARVLLSGNVSGSDEKRAVDWLETDENYILKAELPDVGKNSIQVCVEGGKVLELCGVWMQQKNSISRTIHKDWKSGNWWEYGFVRRVELPEDADCRKMEASLMHDKVLEISIPKGY